MTDRQMQMAMLALIWIICAIIAIVTKKDDIMVCPFLLTLAYGVFVMFSRG